MKKNAIAFLLFFTICTLLFTGNCSTAAERNTVTQVSTIDALLAGAYDGQMSDQELLTYGDFGIGTFDRLDGEMIVLDGKVYQIKADGKVYTPPGTLSTPFASVVAFAANAKVQVPKGTDSHGLEQLVNEAAPNMNLFCAVKVKGRFSLMKTRSVPAQSKPYPPLTEVTKNQAVFNLENVEGTIVGFRSPPFVKGINVPGYHLHFLADDLKSGGHILDFKMEEGAAEIDVCNRFSMILPEKEGDFSRMDLSTDRSKELDKAEK